MESVARLLARDQHGIKFGLDNIRTLCEALGHPEHSYPTLIAAGTNGKGSVTAMAAAILTAAGYRTGRYTSPHLVRIEERMAIDGRNVDGRTLDAAASEVLTVESGCLERGSLAAPLTFFEITTATAFELFRRERVDAVVLEVGMGGRFDATNAADPAAGAITSIAFDHMRFLGDTLAQIAYEKAGILRSGRPTVVGPLPPEAAAVIREVADERRAVVVEAMSGATIETRIDEQRRFQLRLCTPVADYGSFVLGLRGRHQAVNAAVAVRMLEHASAANLSVGVEAVVRGLSEVRWPGRLQELTLTSDRRVLLDAAHNPAGALTLAQYLAEFEPSPAPLVFGAMADKDVGAMLRTLAPHVSRFIFTQAHSARAMATDDLSAEAARVAPGVPVITARTPEEALEIAFADASFTIVAGSIFLIGDLLPLLEAAATIDSTDASPAYGMLPKGSR